MNKNTLHRRARAWALLAVLLASSTAWSQTPSSSITRVSSFEYDADGVLIKEVIEPDRPNDCLQTSHTLDAYGNRASTSTSACLGASGHTLASASSPRSSNALYQAHSVSVDGLSFNTPAGVFATQLTNALSHSETKTFDPRHGAVLQLTGPNGLSTTWRHDAWGRKTRETRADGTYTLWAYKLCQVSGQPRDPLCPTNVGLHPVHSYASEANHGSDGQRLGPIKLQFHDVLERVVRVQTQDFHGQTVVQDTHYNALGQVERQSVLYRLSGGTPHWSVFTYDAIGRMLSESRPDGNGGTAVSQFAYNGLVTTATNPLGQTQTTHRDVAGKTVKVIDALGSELRFEHDALGQLLETHAAGVVTRISYSQRGHKLSMEDPATGRWDYAHNAHGELVWQQDSLSQVVTTQYDALGRVTRRDEPDLISRWYFDKKADGSACGLGVGKLCEATADNGYRRLHQYDSLGRPSSTATALDSATQLATVSLAYEPTTGRVTSQTWPTGYRASYTYNAQGFLHKVAGVGTAGAFTGQGSASLEILAMDAQGRVTQYRQGNNVITVKAHDEATGKLNSVQATLAGQAAGNVLNHSYSHDAIGNLLSRSDANSGVSESFQYDTLNRLSLYTVLGGGLSGVQSVQTLYDRAGNLKYKSDVGYYHHDAQRPNRLNHITLAPESNWSALGAVTVPNSGTRALSYAWDDSRAGTRSVQGNGGSVPMGNGNLWYTVSQDQTSGRHTVRWESYTSFNMPKAFSVANLGTPGATTPATITGYTCPAGYTLSGTSCSRQVTTPTSAPATPVYSCPSGYTLSGTTCSKTESLASNAYCQVPGSTLNLAQNRCEYGEGSAWYDHCRFYLAPQYGATYIGFQERGQSEGVPYGTCYLAIARSCPAGYSLSGTSCTRTLTQAAALSYSCPANTTLGGTGSASTCNGSSTSTETIAATPIYNCPAGSAVSGSGSNAQCADPTNVVAERTLSFTYGPEHQRIRQTVELSTGAPSHVQPGTTWYLNGTDSQGLTYEKTQFTNGLTEHRHYLSLGNLTFALFVQREGNLNGQTAAQVNYLHHDHLGSLAAISNEAGVVIERLAYDPWGKRRNVNGMGDPLDALYGVNSERGFTMHEHLDEVGVIHMNGRLYDPLIGRFMSADPFIQSPGNLQSHNRYAYVLNNPLAYTDPSGHFFSALFTVFLAAEAAKQLGIIDKDFARMIQGFAVGFMVGASVQPWAVLNGYSVMAAKVFAGMAGGFAGAFVGSGGNFNAALQGAFAGGLFGAAGNFGAAADSGARYLAHAGAGCVSAVASGGKCGQGAAGALFGKFTSNAIGAPGASAGLGDVIARGVATAVAGGIGAELAGGKFASGALTAAYGYLFNACASGHCGASPEENGAPAGEAFGGRNGTVSGQGGLVASGHILVVGASYGETISFDTNGQVCTAQSACLRVGPGVYVGAGAQYSWGYRNDLKPQARNDFSLSIGMGGDLGTGGWGMGGQMMHGLNDGSVSFSKGWIGYGAGMSIGIDICVQRVRSCIP